MTDHPDQLSDGTAEHADLRLTLGRRRYQHETTLRALRQAHGFDLDAALGAVGRAYDRLDQANDRCRDDIQAAHAAISRHRPPGPHWQPPAVPAPPGPPRTPSPDQAAS